MISQHFISRVKGVEMGWGGEDVGLLFGCRSLIQALLHITGNVLVFTIHISAIAEDSYSTHCLDCIKE